MCNISKNDQVRLRNENAEIETEIDELKRKIAKYTTMWDNLPKKTKPQVNYLTITFIAIRFQSIKIVDGWDKYSGVHSLDKQPAKHPKVATESNEILRNWVIIWLVFVGHETVHM